MFVFFHLRHDSITRLDFCGIWRSGTGSSVPDILIGPLDPENEGWGHYPFNTLAAKYSVTRRQIPE